MKIPTFILEKTNINNEKIWHYYLSACLWISSYTLFAYTVIIFLNNRLASEIWVGIFLGIGSIIAIIMDIPFGQLQKKISPRISLSLATFGLIITVLIFLFAYQNILFIFIAAILYGLSHDLYDITMLSYIFSNTIPAQYGESISQRNVAESIGIVLGLASSGIILYFGSFIAQIALIVILIVSLITILLIFDKDSKKNESIDEVLTHTIQELSSKTIKGLKRSAISVLDITEKSIKSIKISLNKGKIYLKPLKNDSYKFIDNLKDSFIGISNIVFGKKINIHLIWSFIIILLFSFWDTFVITYEPLFLGKILETSNLPRIISGGIIMTLFILPLFFFYIPFSKLADKYGREKFIILGLLISGVSLFLFGQTDSIWLIIVLGMTNSIGYAAAMPSSQAFFAEIYNEHFAIVNNVYEIDSNNSAAPLKMTINIGNIIGQIFGGVLIWIFNFNVFFIIFGFILMVFFGVSLLLYFIIRKPPYIYNDEGNIIS